MSVVLLILKIIGIILLALLGVFLLVVSLVLFVPVRYQISGLLEDEKTMRGRILWLFPILNWGFVYEKGQIQTKRLRICGIPLKMKKKKKAMEEEEEPDAEDVYAEDIGLHAEDTEAPLEKRIDMADKSEKREPKAAFLKIRNTFFHIKDKMSDIKKLITDETNQKAIVSVLSELKYMLRHFKFRKIDTNLTFSLADPATTGHVLGVLCMLPFMYQYSIRIYPDFEADEVYVRGNFAVAGRIRLIHVLVCLMRFMKKHEFRFLLNKIM